MSILALLALTSGAAAFAPPRALSLSLSPASRTAPRARAARTDAPAPAAGAGDSPVAVDAPAYVAAVAVPCDFCTCSLCDAFQQELSYQPPMARTLEHDD